MPLPQAPADLRKKTVTTQQQTALEEVESWASARRPGLEAATSSYREKDIVTE